MQLSTKHSSQYSRANEVYKSIARLLRTRLQHRRRPQIFKYYNTVDGRRFSNTTTPSTEILGVKMEIFSWKNVIQKSWSRRQVSAYVTDPKTLTTGVPDPKIVLLCNAKSWNLCLSTKITLILTLKDSHDVKPESKQLLRRIKIKW